MYFPKIKANSQATNMAAKNDGSESPSVEIPKRILSSQGFEMRTFTMPSIIPTINAKLIETAAKSNVFGNASPIIADTFFLL